MTGPDAVLCAARRHIRQPYQSKGLRQQVRQQQRQIGSGLIPPGTPLFDPARTFDHMHPGPGESWIVQVGQIRGQCENTGDLAFDAYQLINMNGGVGQGSLPR
jgi:hypothetical protein